MIHLNDTIAAEAYKDVVARLLGEDRPIRFLEAEKRLAQAFVWGLGHVID